MVSIESRSIDQPSSPRISFSAEFLDESNFISISPNPEEDVQEIEREKARNAEFEFLSNNNTVSSHAAMLTADELFFEGKLLPFWQMQQSEKLLKINLKSQEQEEEVNKMEETTRSVNWVVDDDPSPRPPNCTVLWKELLRLKKQRASALSPSSSSSTSSSSSSFGDVVNKEEGKEGAGNREKHGKRMKKGLERTRSATIRIRPMVNVPICTQVKTNGLPPLFSLKKGRLER